MTIPGHLQRYDWYAPHMAWLRRQGLEILHDSGDAQPARAYLAYANLRRAKLAYANLRRANLAYANLERAHLAYADLTGAYLAGANLSSVNLVGAHLSSVNLVGAHLSYANLTGAEGVVELPVGGQRGYRSLMVAQADGSWRYYGGCRGPWTVAEARAHFGPTYHVDRLTGDRVIEALDWWERTDGLAERCRQAAMPARGQR